MSAALVNRAILQYNSGSMAAALNKSSFQYVYFSLGYIILGKGCHILYVFGLNSTVFSHIVDVHLSSVQDTYDFMMDADLYNSFLLRLGIE